MVSMWITVGSVILCSSVGAAARPQKTPDGRSIVRATLIYGENNPVDGAVLEVILRKAEKIRVELGVPVPLPDEGHTLTQALMKAVFMRRRKGPQLQLGFDSTTEAQAIDGAWRDAAERARRSRTVFAQRRLKPEDVLPEWHKTLAAIGGREDVQRFTGRSLARLGQRHVRRERRDLIGLQREGAGDSTSHGPVVVRVHAPERASDHAVLAEDGVHVAEGAVGEVRPRLRSSVAAARRAMTEEQCREREPDAASRAVHRDGLHRDGDRVAASDIVSLAARVSEGDRCRGVRVGLFGMSYKCNPGAVPRAPRRSRPTA